MRRDVIAGRTLPTQILVTVVIWLVWAVDRNTDVGSLIFAQHGELRTKLAEV